MREYAQEIADKMRAAARAKVRKHVPLAASAGAEDRRGARAATRAARLSTEKIIVIGASTGGTEAIREVLVGMPPDCPGILIAQHMPAAFTRSFADRLNGLCQITVKEAEHGERVLPGHAYIAPGDAHLLLRRSGANYVTRAVRRAAGQPAPAVGRRAVPLGGERARAATPSA